MIFFALILGLHAAFCAAMFGAAIRCRRNPDPSGEAGDDLKVVAWLAGFSGLGISICLMAGIALNLAAMLVGGGIAMLGVMMLIAVSVFLPALGIRAAARRRVERMAALAGFSGAVAGLTVLAILLGGR